jgi:nicotinamidase-related amidase
MTEDLDFSRTALLVVDMQYGDAHRDWGLLRDKQAAGLIDDVERYATRLEDIVIPNIQRLLAAFRSSGGEVMYVRIESLTHDGRDRGAQHREKGIHFPPGSQEGKILEEIASVGDELVLSKTCGSAFRGTNIEYLLRNMSRDCVVVVGVVTGSCVQATAIDAAAQGFTTLVVDDATATWNDEMQAAALATMRERGVQVVTTDALASAEAHAYASESTGVARLERLARVGED